MVIPNHSYVKDGIRYLKIKVDIMLSGGAVLHYHAVGCTYGSRLLGRQILHQPRRYFGRGKETLSVIA